jgi:hypothetical protein
MLTIVNTTVERDDDEAVTFTRYEVEGHAVLAGDSIWGYNYERYGDAVRVRSIGVTEHDEDDGLITVNVEHDAGWRIYTDTGFAHSISELLGRTIQFTEQGMQEDGMASME